MKKVLLFTVIAALTIGVFAQAPQKFNYQAVARDNAGEVLNDANLTVQIEVLQNDVEVWQEDHEVTTNAFGLFSLQIGGPDAINASGSAGNFEDIAWGSGDYDINVKVDHGSGFIDMGKSELLSVPYALHAANGPPGPEGPQGPAGEQGPIGPQGDPGPQGTEGIQGTKGDAGDTGATGPTGNTGPIGPQGPQGDAGTGLVNRGDWLSGTSYDPGDYVFDRSTDDAGINSMWILEGDVYVSSTQPFQDAAHWVEFQAPAGPQGIQGIQGETGPTGPAGIQGVEGPQGVKGDVGDTGAQGATGAQGIQGIQGIQGPEASDDQTLTLAGTDLSISNGNSVDLTPLVNDADSDASNEIQDISVAGSQISITSGSTQDLSHLIDDADADAANELQGLSYTKPALTLSNGGGTVDLSDLVDDLDSDPSNEIQNLSLSGGGILSLTGDPTPVNLDNRIENISGWSLDNDTIVTVNTVAILTKDAQDVEPLFEVRNDLGHPVFAVFNDGVMVYVDEDKKGVKGGFAVGGYNTATKGVTQEYLRVTPDSVRIYIPEVDPSGKGVKGGFAVGGYNTATKDVVANYMEVTRSNTNIYFDTSEIRKGVKGGFAVGGYNTASKAGISQMMSLTPQNYLIGEDAGMNLTTGSRNTFLGYRAGIDNTVGNRNIFMGRESGFTNLGADDNIFIGNQSGYKTYDGHGNVYIGNQSGYDNRAGFFNTFVGYQSGYYNTSHYNSFFGYQAGYNNKSGKSNTFIGHHAGYGLPVGGPGVTGGNNVFIGVKSGYSATTGANNVFIGNSAGRANTTGNQNVFLGNQAGYSNVEGISNVFIGDGAGFSNQYGDYNTIMGFEAGHNLTGSTDYWEGSQNTIMGYQAGHDIRKGFRNVLIGYRAGFSIRDNRYNLIIGDDAGYNLIGELDNEMSGQANLMLGYSAGRNLETGSINIFVGFEAGHYCDPAAEGNLFIGHGAGLSSASSGSVFIGKYAGYNEDLDNKLIINNSGYTGTDNLNNSLIYGDFSSKYIKVNGQLTSETDIAYGFAGTFINDGNFNSRNGLKVQAGTDDGSGTNFMYTIYDGNGTYEGGLILSNGLVSVAGTSDVRLKRDIVNTSISAVSLLKSLRVVDFSYIKNPNVKHTGYIAQEVKEVIPEMVNYNEMEDVYTTSPSTLIPVLHKAIQEQQAQIDMLVKRIAELEAK